MKFYLWQAEFESGGGVGSPPVPAPGEIVAEMDLPDLARETPADVQHADYVVRRMGEMLYEKGRALPRPCSPAAIEDALRTTVIPAYAGHEALAVPITVTAPPATPVVPVVALPVADETPPEPEPEPTAEPVADDRHPIPRGRRG